MMPISNILRLLWVRRLIGKPGVPYNRRLRVRGSPHPLNYDAGLSLPVADSNTFRIQADLPRPDRLTASWTVLDSSGATVSTQPRAPSTVSASWGQNQNQTGPEAGVPVKWPLARVLGGGLSRHKSRSVSKTSIPGSDFVRSMTDFVI